MFEIYSIMIKVCILPHRLTVPPGHGRRQGDVAEPLTWRQRRLAKGVNQQGVVVRAHRAGGEVTVKDDPEGTNSTEKDHLEFWP